MQSAYDYLYYICYSAIFKGRKYGTGEERASAILSVTVSLYMISLYFFITVQLELIPIDPMLLSFSIMALLSVMMHIHSSYFVKTRRYIKIRKKYVKSFNKRKALTLSLVIIACLGSFVAFFLTGIFFGLYANPH